MNARLSIALLCATACVTISCEVAEAAIARVPAGTMVALRPVAPIAGPPGDVVILEVDRDVTIGGRLAFARGALARGTLTAGAPGIRIAIDWVMDTSGDKVTTVGDLLVLPLPVTATIREQDITVPDTYDPNVR